MAPCGDGDGDDGDDDGGRLTQTTDDPGLSNAKSQVI